MHHYHVHFSVTTVLTLHALKVIILILLQYTDCVWLLSVTRPDATVVPTLRFHIDADSITVYNNELGFEEPNVRAVCDVGKTTKGKHKFGYIGA